jgi:hypothetical protein
MHADEDYETKNETTTDDAGTDDWPTSTANQSRTRI